MTAGRRHGEVRWSSTSTSEMVRPPWPTCTQGGAVTARRRRAAPTACGWGGCPRQSLSRCACPGRPASRGASLLHAVHTAHAQVQSARQVLGAAAGGAGCAGSVCAQGHSPASSSACSTTSRALRFSHPHLVAAAWAHLLLQGHEASVSFCKWPGAHLLLQPEQRLRQGHRVAQVGLGFRGRKLQSASANGLARTSCSSQSSVCARGTASRRWASRIPASSSAFFTALARLMGEARSCSSSLSPSAPAPAHA